MDGFNLKKQALFESSKSLFKLHYMKTEYTIIIIKNLINHKHTSSSNQNMAHKNNPNRVKDTEITYVRQKNESHHNETTKKKISPKIPNSTE